MSNAWPNPFIEQRADPFILRHDTHYYFIASVPEHDRLEIRRADSIAGLRAATPVVVWRKPDSGPFSQLIRAPELHVINGEWVIYFAAAPACELQAGLLQHRMYALVCQDADPLRGDWQPCRRVFSHIDSLSLDATHFAHQGKHWYLWAQKDPAIPGHSNLYLAQLLNPWTIKGQPIMLSRPEYEWECAGFSVNEGPAAIRHGDRLFVTYSASATDENYCLGLLSIDVNADPMQIANWHKSARPVFGTSWHNRQYGPGQMSFTLDESGREVMVYHARNATDCGQHPFWDPDRHTRLKSFHWREDGTPDFGVPPADHTSAP